MIRVRAVSTGIPRSCRDLAGRELGLVAEKERVAVDRIEREQRRDDLAAGGLALHDLGGRGRDVAPGHRGFAALRPGVGPASAGDEALQRDREPGLRRARPQTALPDRGEPGLLNGVFAVRRSGETDGEPAQQCVVLEEQREVDRALSCHRGFALPRVVRRRARIRSIGNSGLRDTARDGGRPTCPVAARADR